MNFTVKQARQYAGLTQIEMAQKLSISRDSYRKIEAEPDKTTVGMAMKISEVTSIPLDKIFFAKNST